MIFFINFTPLTTATKLDNISIVQLLLECPQIDINSFYVFNFFSFL